MKIVSKKTALINGKSYGLNGKLVLYIFISLILTAVIISLTIFFIRGNSENAVVAKVNGETISAREFKQILIRDSSNIYRYFKQKYNADDNKNFWITSYSNEVPIEKARKEALEQLIRIKVQQVMAKQNGLLSDTSYKSFLKSMEEENHARRKAISKRQVIYGPQQYGENEYFTYTQNNMVTKLKGKLAEGELSVTDTEIKDFYDLKKDENFKKEDGISIQKITISFADEKKIPVSKEKSEAESKSNEIRNRLDNGEKPEDIVKLYNIGTVKAILEEQTLDDNSERGNLDHSEDLLWEAGNLDTGKVSSVIEQGNTFIVFKILEKKSMGYKPFDEVKKSIKSQIIDKKYEEMLDKLVQEAKVEVIPSKYNSVWVR